MIEVFERENVTCGKVQISIAGQKANPVFVFIVDGMLIDTGPERAEASLIPFYENYSFELVTLTHSHEDHSGTAPWIEKNRNVPIYVHPNGIEICAEPYPYPLYRQLTWGKREAFTAVPLGDTIQSRSREWEVIYTPGHADDHVSLFNKETGQLFSGDLFVHPETKVIMNTESIPVIMDSIRKLLTYDFDSMFCCHAGFIQNGKKVLKEKLENLENLTGEVKEFYQQGLSLEEINAKLFPKKYPIITISEGEWDSLHIVSSIIAEFQ
ncbi:MBL fold metallo-hydrolase [Pueribacillus sp. YX66]|uniref:MBL fold metallo-hydrolase n=1 Tax=Pueribacillus sp. YX66 TaxID=3229242 RepID=UPI00358D4C4C